MPNPRRRLPRFKRAADAAGSFKMTARDLEILRHVAEHRFIRSEWLVKLVGGSPQQVLRRLQLLFHYGYLERPKAQLDYFHQAGSRSLAYGLASRGAGRLRRNLNMPFERMDWTTRNGVVRRLFLEHTLMVSGFMAALELECRQRSDVRLLYTHELPKPASKQDLREPFRWTVDLPGKRRVGVVPDKAFAIEVTHSDGRSERTHCFLEADRGTMPIKRRDLRQSCVLRKLKAYEATYTSRLHRPTLGTDRFRVLFLTQQSGRVKQVGNSIAELSKARRLFVVSSEVELLKSGSPLSLLLPLPHLERPLPTTVFGSGQLPSKHTA